MNTHRFNLNDFYKIKDVSEIPGNFTSVIGEYLIPNINKTGFYKQNGCMLDAMDDADLRELFASKILNKIGMPCADIVLVNDSNSNGCLSMNILNSNEEFVDPDSVYTSPFNSKPINTVNDFIESDISKISTLPNVTPEYISSRSTFIKNYLLANALLSNTDIKMDNMMPIYNSQTNTYRNPEIYDLGIAFISNERRFFFNYKTPNDIIQELYSDHSDEIFPLAQNIEMSLTPEVIDQILEDEAYKGFSVEILSQIKTDLLDRISTISRYNHNVLEYGIANPQISTEQIAERTKDVNISLKDKVYTYLNHIKNKVIGKDYKDNAK